VFRQHIRVTVRHNYVDPKKKKLFKQKNTIIISKLNINILWKCTTFLVHFLSAGYVLLIAFIKFDYEKKSKFKSLVQNKLFFSRNCQVGGEVNKTILF